MNKNPGWKTTEFWLTLVSQAIGLAYASGAIPAEGPAAKVVGLAVIVLASMGYSVSRGLAKKAG